MSNLDRRTSAELAPRTEFTEPTMSLFIGDHVVPRDNRKPGKAVTRAWLDSATLAGWTEAEAREAITWHGTFRPDVYLTPAHVTAYIALSRQRKRLQAVTDPATGIVRPGLTEALELWSSEHRRVAGSPTSVQARAAEVELAEMLDGAEEPLPVLCAAVMAARGGSEQIGRARTKLLRAPDVLRTPPLPPEYLTDAQLDVHNAVRHPEFPADWAVYPAESRRPQWIADWMADAGGVFTPEETRARNAVRHQADEWESDDVAAWRTERLPVVRDFLRQPARRDYTALDDVRLDQPVRTVDQRTGRTFER